MGRKKCMRNTVCHVLSFLCVNNTFLTVWHRLFCSRLGQGSVFCTTGKLLLYSKLWSLKGTVLQKWKIRHSLYTTMSVTVSQSVKYYLGFTQLPTVSRPSPKQLKKLRIKRKLLKEIQRPCLLYSRCLSSGTFCYAGSLIIAFKQKALMHCVGWK